MDPTEAAMIESDSIPSRSRSLLLAILLVGATAIGFALLLKQSMPPDKRESSRIGMMFPELKVIGWLNGPGPKPDSLKGKVLVVDAWAYWCGPCRMAAPDLIALAKQYRDRDVLFLGLTSEGSGSLSRSQEFLDTTGIPWPNGYGAGAILDELESETIPVVWVVGRDGRIVEEINGFDPSHTAVKQAIEYALAQEP